MVGNATAGGDSMTLFVGANATNMNGDNSLSASSGWTIAEFNVFGGPGGAARHLQQRGDHQDPDAHQLRR